MEFKNYFALCSHFGLKPNSGKSPICQLNKLGKEYKIEKKGNKYILEEKEKEEIKRDRILKILKNSERNSFYLKNNFLIYLYKLAQAPENIYAVYNIQQMRDFGFLREDLKPVYAYNTFIYQNPTYNIKKEFKEKLDNILSKAVKNKKTEEIIGEVYNTLHDRYTKLMNTTLFSLVSANKYFDISSNCSQGEWNKFMSRFKRSLNILSKEIKLIAIPKDGGAEYELENEALFDYLEIRNDVILESGVSNVDYETGLKMKGAIYSRIQERCKKELGIEVVYKKLYYGLISNLDEFHITGEQYEEARKLNNERMKNTLINYFTKKCGKDKVLAEAYKEAILYIADIND